MAIFGAAQAPVFIVGGARSGTSMLFELLSASPHLWSAYRELHGIFEWDIGLHPDVAAGESNQLTALDATPQRVQALRRALRRVVSNREVRGFPSDRLPRVAILIGRTSRVLGRELPFSPRIVEKNPKSCFRVGFLRAVFPQARFLFLLRHPLPNIYSLIEGWESQRYLTYDVPGTGCAYPRWSFDLPPGWRDWADRPLPELCARQWAGYNQAILEQAAKLPAAAQLRCHYEGLVADPLGEARRIFDWLELPLTGPALRRARRPPIVNATSPPDPRKWRMHEDEIRAQERFYLPLLQPLGYNAEPAEVG